MDSLIVPKPWDDALSQAAPRTPTMLLGAKQNLVFDRFEGGHRWNGAVAYPLFENVLK